MIDTLRDALEHYRQLPSLIAPDDAWSLAALILVGVAVSIYLEQTYRWAAKISGPVLCLVAAMLLANLKVMPSEAPVYDLVDAYLIPVAIPLLLFRANVARILRSTGRMFLAFHLSALGTLVGAVLAAVRRLPARRAGGILERNRRGRPWPERRPRTSAKHPQQGAHP